MTKILLIIISLLCISCRSVRYVPIEVMPDSIAIERIDTLVIPPDSATINALLECNDHGKVILRDLDMRLTENVKLKFQLDSVGRLLAVMSAKHDTVFIPAKTVYKDRPVPYEIPAKIHVRDKLKYISIGVAIIFAAQLMRRYGRRRNKN